MSKPFSIGVSWLPRSYGPAEISECAASITIKVGDQIATEIEDSWSKSVQPATRVSAYPLALWVASSWWRLRWEAEPFRAAPDLSWRMSHTMSAAGHGFLWPDLRFDSDGEQVRVVSVPTHPLSNEPIRYLANFTAAVSAKEFESEWTNFLELVLARLDAVGASETGLHRVLGELFQECLDPDSARARELEARLGFDPDDVPDELMATIIGLASTAGPAAVDEIAPVCAGEHPVETLKQIEAFAASDGVTASFTVPGALIAANGSSVAPWERGRKLAHAARGAYGLDAGPIGDAELASLFHSLPSCLGAEVGASTRPPLGLAIRDDGDRLKLLFRRKNRLGRRFEAARFLADRLLMPDTERWLPATDSKTARQKVQRAFAAEFLCPIDSLKDLLQGDFSDESITDASEHFGVSERAVTSHLANNHLIPHDWALL